MESEIKEKQLLRTFFFPENNYSELLKKLIYQEYASYNQNCELQLVFPIYKLSYLKLTSNLDIFNYKHVFFRYNLGLRRVR